MDEDYVELIDGDRVARLPGGAAQDAGIATARLRGLMWLCSPVVIEQCGWDGAVAAMQAAGIVEIGLRAETIDEAVVAHLEGLGFIVHAWAAHSREAALRMFRFKVASFTTDRPDLANAARDEAERDLA